MAGGGLRYVWCAALVIALCATGGVDAAFGVLAFFSLRVGSVYVREGGASDLRLVLVPAESPLWLSSGRVVRVMLPAGVWEWRGVFPCYEVSMVVRVVLGLAVRVRVGVVVCCAGCAGCL